MDSEEKLPAVSIMRKVSRSILRLLSRLAVPLLTKSYSTWDLDLCTNICTAKK